MFAKTTGEQEVPLQFNVIVRSLQDLQDNIY